MPEVPLYGFSTIGNPHDSLKQSFQLLGRFNLDFLEVRALSGASDLLLAPDFKDNGNLVGGPVQLVASTLCLASCTRQDLEAFCRLAMLADRIGAPYIRIFGAGGAEIDEEPDEALWQRMSHVVKEIRSAFTSMGLHCEPLLETHDIFSSSSRCLAFDAFLCEPLNFLWDSHHTWWLGGETLKETWAALGSRVRHVHYKDSVPSVGDADGLRYVLPGCGDFPSDDLAQVLQKDEYAGGISLEWEKMWRPELPALEQALERFQSHFVTGMKSLRTFSP